MLFTEITVHTTSEGSELVADALWQYTTYGVAVSDVRDVIALQTDSAMYWDYIDEGLRTGGEALVKAFVPAEETAGVLPRLRADMERLLKAGAGFVPFGTLEITCREVEGDDWLEIWRTHFRPIHIGASIVVCPEWIEYAPKEGERVVKLDSNMAFGTGEHETTAMCLKLLQDCLTPRAVCIDVGCGSGILGISAVLLGADRAYLTDIDPVAVSSAEHNAEINGVSDKVNVVRSDLLSSDIEADIILANITGEILCRLAPTIPVNLKRGGALILSGIIESRLDMVKCAFSAQGLTVEKTVREGEWYALLLR